MKPRWLLAAWVLLVLLGHWVAWSGWRQGLSMSDLNRPPIERLSVDLHRPVTLQRPQVAERVLKPRGTPAPEVRMESEPVLKEPVALDPKPLEPSAATPEPAPAAADGAASEASAQSQGSEAGSALGAEWPRSLRLKYRLNGHYRGPVFGEAEVEWLRQGLRYQVRLRVQVGPSLTPFLRRELVSDGVITPEGIRPRRYDESTQLLLSPARRASLVFEPGRLQDAAGRWHEAPEAVQDSASQFVHLAWLFLTGRVTAQEGETIALPLALPRGVYPWRYALEQRQSLESVMGLLDTWYLVPQGVQAPGALMAEVWLAPELHFMPVQLLIRQGEDNWVQLSLAEAPLEEDAAPQNAPSQPASDPP